MEANLASIDQIKRTAIDLGMNFGPRLLVAVLIMVAGYFAGRWVGRMLGRGLARIELEPPVRLLLIRVARVLVLLLFGILALQNLGVQLLPLIAGLGVLGAGVALATQGVLSNVVAGLTVIFTKPFRVGEYISLLGEQGEVLQITLFNTTLGHTDRSRVVIPNRKVVVAAAFASRAEVTVSGDRRHSLPLGSHQEVDACASSPGSRATLCIRV